MMKQTKAEVAPVSGQHTPGQWKIAGDTILPDGTEAVSIINESIFPAFICHCEGPKRLANAAFIVRACNAHDELVNALELAQATIERLHRHAPGSAQGTLDVIANALAKTTKEVA